jgi:hypothetical protein
MLRCVVTRGNTESVTLSLCFNSHGHLHEGARRLVKGVLIYQQVEPKPTRRNKVLETKPYEKGNACLKNGRTPKVSLSDDFISLFSTHSYFENSAEEFHPHETLSVPIKLLLSLSSLIW